MNINRNQPATWDQYDGVHRASVDSTGTQGSRVQWDALHRRPSGDGDGESDGEGAGSPSRFGTLRRRR